MALIPSSNVSTYQQRQRELWRNVNLALKNLTASPTTTTTAIETTDDAVSSNMPEAPQNVTIVGESYVPAQGISTGQIFLDWDDVTTTVEGEDTVVVHYEVWGMDTDEDAYHWITTVDESSALLTGFDSESTWEFVIRALGDVPGEWSDPVSTFIEGDTEPPPKLSTPTCSVYLGNIDVLWDGKPADPVLDEIPPDFAAAIVHGSTDTGFTPSDATIVGFINFIQGGTASISGLTYGTPYYFRFVGVDRTGNEGIPSDESLPAIPERAVSNDLAQSFIDDIVNDTVTAVNASAGGKNKITHSPDTPTNYTGQTAGDTWFQYSGTTVIGWWRAADATTWVQETLAETWLPQVNIGSGTYGVMDGDRILANSIAVTKLAVVDFQNFWANPYFRDVGVNVNNFTKQISTDSGVPASCPYPTVGKLANARDTFSGDQYMSFRSGDAFYAEMWVCTTTATKPISLGVHLADSDTGSVAYVSITPPRTPTGTWTKVSGTLSITNATATQVRAWLQVNGTDGVDCQGWYVTGITVRRANTAELIVDGSVTANKLTTDLVLATNVYAGNPSSSHVKLNSQGLFRNIYDPDAGTVVESFHLGGSDADFLALRTAAGRVVAAIDGDGNGSFSSVATDALTVAGQPIDAMTSNLPRGLKKIYTCTTSSATASSTTEVSWMEFRQIVEADRMYRIQVNPHLIDSTSTGNIFEGTLRYALDSAVSTSSALVSGAPIRREAPSTSQSSGPPLVGILDTGAGLVTGIAEARFLYTVGRASGAGNVQGIATVNYPAVCTIEDIGPSLASASNEVIYTSTWYTTSTRANNSNGTARTDSAYLGYANTPLTVGDCYSANNWSQIIFGGNASLGETSRTIASAMSGATLVKAELYLYCQLTESGDATITIYPNTRTTLSSTAETSGGISKTFSPAQGKWVDITSIWTTSKLGIQIGAAGEHSHFRSFYSPDTTKKPQIRLTYRRTN